MATRRPRIRRVLAKAVVAACVSRSRGEVATAPRRLIDDRPPPRFAGQQCAAHAAAASMRRRPCVN